MYEYHTDTNFPKITDIPILIPIIWIISLNLMGGHQKVWGFTVVLTLGLRVRTKTMQMIYDTPLPIVLHQ